MMVSIVSLSRLHLLEGLLGKGESNVWMRDIPPYHLFRAFIVITVDVCV